MTADPRALLALCLLPAGLLLPRPCLAAPQAADELVLAADGQTSYRIWSAEGASAPERTAARELADYLQRTTGAQFAIGEPTEAGSPVIAVGPGAAGALKPDLNLDRSELGEDGIVLRTAGPHLILTGAEGSRRGTLYAVYEFLQRVVGVRWWTPTEEFVPARPTLTVEPLDVRYRPPFLYREVFGWGMVQEERQWGYDDSDAAALNWDKARFAARLRNNGHGTSMPQSLGGCYMPLGWCHTFYPFMPPDKYFEDHPEWYSEIDGKRVHQGAQLCMTNDEMLEELSRNVLAAIREQPHLGIVVLTMNDWHGNCQCSECRALDEAEGSPMGSLLYGVNKVAEAVEQEFPEMLVATHAYIYARKPPRTIRPRDNVLIWLCVIERSAPQPIDSDENRTLMEDLQGWAQAAPRLFMWDYTMNLPGPLAPYPNWQVFADDLRTYRDHNAVGVFMESESVGFSHFVELKVNLMAHLLWDPSQDEQALIDEFLRGYYGAAAPALGEAMAALQERAKGHRLTWHDGPDAHWLDLATMNRVTELLSRAEAAVAAEPELLMRVRRSRLSIDHQWLRGYGLYRQQAAQQGVDFLGPADPAESAAELSARVRAEAATWTPDFMTRGISSCMGGMDAYLDSLQRLAAAAGKSAPLPPIFAEIPRSQIVDMDESLATVFTYAGASIVEDPRAANGLAMKVPRAQQPSWAVQAKTRGLGDLGGFGTYQVYAVVRCEVQAEEGAAFVGGVWDDRNRTGLGAVSYPIGAPAPPPTAEEIDRNPDIRFATIAGGDPVTDDEYHVYDFGTHDLSHGDISIWVGTTTGDIYVDRFVLVRK